MPTKPTDEVQTAPFVVPASTIRTLEQRITELETQLSIRMAEYGRAINEIANTDLVQLSTVFEPIVPSIDEVVEQAVNKVLAITTSVDPEAIKEELRTEFRTLLAMDSHRDWEQRIQDAELREAMKEI